MWNWNWCSIPGQNTSYKTVQRTHSKEHVRPSFRDKLWGSKEELQTTVQFINNMARGKCPIWYSVGLKVQ